MQPLVMGGAAGLQRRIGSETATMVTQSRSTVNQDGSRLRQLAIERPLAHPLFSSVALHDYEYPPPRHIREMYGAAYRALSPKHPHAAKNLLRLYPREHAKSEAVAHVIPTWAALRNPNIRILILSQSQKQANNKLDLCRRTINQWGPQFNRTIVRDAARELTLARNENWDVATITAAGFETSITGGHFDILVFDDFVDYSNQRTEIRRETVENEFQNYLNLGSQGESLYFVIGTRKHPQDLYSRLIQSPAWDHEVRQAISDFSVVENEEFEVITSTGERYESIRDVPDEETVTGVWIDEGTRQRIDVLWPERWPLEKLIYDYLTASTEGEGSLVWVRENQNRADALTGQILSEDMLHWVEDLPKSDDAYSIYAGVDVGLVDDPEEAATGDTDYWAVAVIAHDPMDNVSFLVEVRRRRGMTMKEGQRWVQQVLAPFDVNRVLVESNQAQRWLVQEARDDGMIWQGTRSKGQKAERILAMSSRFESGKVRIADTHLDGPDERWQAFVAEWVEFSGDADKHAHDDLLDACEVALRNISMEHVTRSRKISDLPLGW